MPKILVAEDEPQVRKMLVDSLFYAGYDVIEAADGAATLEMACSEQPDLILLDVWMPVMDGLEVLARLRKTPTIEATPVIMVTAWEAAEGEQVAMDLGAIHYITKPWEPGMVEAAVRIGLLGAGTVTTPIKVGNILLDQSLGGGIPVGLLTLIEGSSSAGKSVLCQHLIYGSVRDGHRAACFTSENSIRSLVTQMGSIGLNVAAHVGNGDLLIHPFRAPDPLEDTGASLPEFALEVERLPKKYNIIFVDAITNLASSSPEQAILGFFSSCKRLCSNGKSMILVAHSSAFDEGMLTRLRSLCDAHLRLYVENVRGKQVRIMEVSKVHNADLATGNVVSFTVEPGIGMRIVPMAQAKA